MSQVRFAPLTLLVALAAACSTPGPGAQPPGASAVPPGAGASAPPTAPPGRLVTGTLRLDAAYAIAVAGGRFMKGVAGPYVALGGQIVSNGGGRIVGNNAGGLIPDGANRWRLPLRLAQAPAAPALGETLPAEGVTITVRDLVTGQALAVGEAGGQAIQATATDAQGRFTLTLPPAEGGIVVEARVRDATGRASQDPGLTYDLCPPHDATSVAVDEDSAAVCRLLWLSVYHVLRDALRDAPDGLHRRASLGVATHVAPLTAAATRTGLAGAPAAALDAVSARCAEALVGAVDPWRVRLDGGAGAPAMETLVGLIRGTREAATGRMREAPGLFEGWPALLAANAARPAGTPPWAVRKPADLNRFLTDAFVSRLAPRPELTALLGLPAEDEPTWREGPEALAASLIRDVATGPGAGWAVQLRAIEGWRALAPAPPQSPAP